MDVENPAPSTVAARARRWHPALMWFVLYCAASGALEGMVAGKSGPQPLLLALQIAVSGFLIFWWASDDARRREHPLSRVAPVWIVLFGMFWIVWRLFSSRPRAEAWRGFTRGAWVMIASLAAYLLFFDLFVPDAARG
jgi:hypothetical protein